MMSRMRCLLTHILAVSWLVHCHSQVGTAFLVGLGRGRLQRSFLSGLCTIVCQQREAVRSALEGIVWMRFLAQDEATKPSIYSSLAVSPMPFLYEHLTIIEFIFVVVISKLLKIEVIAKHGSDTTKPFNELIAFARAI